MSHLTRRKFIGAGATATAAATLLPTACVAQPKVATKKRPNVLFIIVDDLRPQLGCYGHSQMKTPHIDRLAQQGILFERNYCQQGLCAPSRASMMAGVRPDTTGITALKTPLVSVRPDLVTLPQTLKNSGYTTISLGKVYHHVKDDPKGWSQPPVWPPSPAAGRGYMLPANRELIKTSKKPYGPATESAPVSDIAYDNGTFTRAALEQLAKLKHETFFLAVGLQKPHLPFSAPQKYWDLYDRDQVQLPASYRSHDAPDAAYYNWGELRTYTDIPADGPVSDAKARELIHGYYAAVSYTDAMVGLLMRQLREQGLLDNTIVFFCTDHGFSLGENTLWCKHNNFDTALHTPMIVRLPDRQNAGGRVAAPTESLDIYPTICDLVEVPKPPHLEGQSLAPLLANPKSAHKGAAYSQCPRAVAGRRVMGYSMRTQRYRFTSWGDLGSELYDHQTDPHEMVNLADNAKTAGQMRAQLIAAMPGASKGAADGGGDDAE